MRLAEYNVLEWQLLNENTSNASTKYYYFSFDASTERIKKRANTEIGGAERESERAMWCLRRQNEDGLGNSII